MEHSAAARGNARTGWSAALSRAAGAILFFELVSGLAITFGPFHPVIEWNLLLHTIVGILTLAPLVWYFTRHFEDYSCQTWSDVLLLGYVAMGALAVCLLSGLAVTGQALFGSHTSPWLRYTHLISTLLTLTASIPHILIAWLRRRTNEAGKGAVGWLGTGILATMIVLAATGALAIGYSGTKYRNHFPPGYSYAFGKDRPFAPSLAHTATNSAYDPRSLSGSETCGSSGCHTQIYREWQTSAHRYAAMDPIFQGIQAVMAKQNGP